MITASITATYPNMDTIEKQTYKMLNNNSTAHIDDGHLAPKDRDTHSHTYRTWPKPTSYVI